MTTDHQKTRSRAERSKSGVPESGVSKSDAPKSGEPEAPEQAKEKRTEYLTAHQLAEVLQVSQSTIHRLRRAGRIPAVALTDRLIRFNLRDVQKALRSTHAARSDAGDPDANREQSPQLSFDDLYADFNEQ
ncbi:MAG TPA: helix-turn-helix domain-containing protein [Blastocatellia bacterium]|nr:helix-turn-helix domain-containing protein [Blastocatellia bacterium]